LLRQHGHDVDIHCIETVGDREKHLPFHLIGPAGIFVREIEAALLREEIDAAVHSYKDLPTLSPEGLVIAAMPERLDPADCLLLRPDALASDKGPIPLRHAARVGTGSARREALLRELRPDLVTVPLRGNVPTRINKLRTQDYDAIVLAMAGLERLQKSDGSDNDPMSADVLDGVVTRRLDPGIFVPAPSQGALAVQVRAADGPARDAIAAIDSPSSRREVDVERRLLSLVEGGCQVPVGAWCRSTEHDVFKLIAVLGVGLSLRRAESVGRDVDQIAESVAAELLQKTPVPLARGQA
jgi:hydroxymethylbilane synthase